jgi:glycosyltransferase involved in cell wall biosynthesis
MRVMLLSPTGAPGGAERALVNLASRLPQRNIEPMAVLLGDGRFRAWLEDAGCPVTVIPAARTRHLHRTAYVLHQLVGLARQCDAVVSNQSKGHVYGGLAATRARRPEVWWQHAIPTRSRIELTAAVVPTDMIVCGSQQAGAAQHRMTPRRDVRVIPPGTDVTGIAARAGSGASVRRALRWGNEPIVGIAGRLQQAKGQEDFLRAAALVARRHPQTRFLVVGGAVLGWEGNFPDQLSELAAKLGLSERVHFAGHQDDVYPWLDAMDVVVHASFYESFGLALVEAMALGKPLVATAAGGPTEIVEDGLSGLLVPAGDHVTLADAIQRILGDPVLKACLSKHAVKRAHAFSADRTADQFGEVLATLAKSSASPR